MKLTPEAHAFFSELVDYNLPSDLIAKIFVVGVGWLAGSPPEWYKIIFSIPYPETSKINYFAKSLVVHKSQIIPIKIKRGSRYVDLFYFIQYCAKLRNIRQPVSRSASVIICRDDLP